jgi:hypothetical protein
MDENTVRRVMIAFLEEQRQRFKPMGGAGPDILKEDGTAIEIKGSRVPQRTLEQLTRYAFTHSDIELALPYDALEPDFVYGLWVIEHAIARRTTGRERRLGVYIVGKVELPHVEEGTYAVFRFNSVTELLDRINGDLQYSASLPYDIATEEAIKRTSALALEVNERIKVWMKTQCIETPMSYKVKLQGANIDE